MKDYEFPALPKSIPYIIVELLEYTPNANVVKTILKKSTGVISVMSFEMSEGLIGKYSSYETFAQIIEGNIEFIIEEKTCKLDTGQSIKIPALQQYTLKADSSFKMILTIIKDGNEKT